MARIPLDITTIDANGNVLAGVTVSVHPWQSGDGWYSKVGDEYQLNAGVPAALPIYDTPDQSVTASVTSVLTEINGRPSKYWVDEGTVVVVGRITLPDSTDRISIKHEVFTSENYRGIGPDWTLADAQAGLFSPGDPVWVDSLKTTKRLATKVIGAKQPDVADTTARNDLTQGMTEAQRQANHGIYVYVTGDREYIYNSIDNAWRDFNTFDLPGNPMIDPAGDVLSWEPDMFDLENLHGQGIEFDASEAATYAARAAAGLPTTVQQLGVPYRAATAAEKDAYLGATGSTVDYSNLPDANTGDWVRTSFGDSIEALSDGTFRVTKGDGSPSFIIGSPSAQASFAITSPANGAVLTGTSQLVEFDLPDGYLASIRAGSTLDGNDYFAGGALADRASQTADNLPDNGETVYVRVTYNDGQGGPEQFIYAQYTAHTAVATGGGSATSGDRIQTLMNSPDKIGFGANTTGGAAATSFVTVVNTNDTGTGSLTWALQQPTPLWITFDPAIHGQTIPVERLHNTTTRDITIDGRGANMTLRREGGFTGVLYTFRGGNTILVDITVDSDGVGTSLMTREGDDYWLDQIRVINGSDDAISVGQGNKTTTSASEVTISNYHVSDDSALGLQIGGNDSFPDFPLARLTVHKCNLGARDRNPRAQYGTQVHVFNSYVNSFTFGGMDAGRATDADQTGQIISENNVFSALNANNSSLAQTGRPAGSGPTGHVFSSGDLFLDSATSSGSINPTTVQPFDIPYAYNLMPAADVVAHVLANAGAGHQTYTLT